MAMNDSKAILKEAHGFSPERIKNLEEQLLLFNEGKFLPSALPRLQELRPAANLAAIFDDCHNYVYANEGLLKDKIFHEMVKLLVMKLYDEKNASKHGIQFGLTSSEYKNILANIQSGFQDRINRLFGEVRSEYHPFFSDDNLKLKPLTLAYIVSRFQQVSLTHTPGDIKGEAFQAFVYRHQRGDRGEFFTPHPIVKLAVQIMDPKPREKVIDPACGSGGFLIQTISYISRSNPSIDKSAYVRGYIRGIEFNPDVALSAMIRLAFEGGEGREIIHANTLGESEDFNNDFDIVLTNPPFGSKGKVEDQNILRPYLLARKWNRIGNDKWNVTRNVLAGQSPEILFIEKSLKLLQPGGRMAIVLPDGLLQNVSNGHVRFWLRSQAKVLGVISIPQEAFVPYGTGIKTSLLLLQKLPANANKVFMARIQKIGYDVKGQPVYKRDNKGKLIKTLSGAHVIDDDINKITDAYSQFKTDALKGGNEKVFLVPEKMLNGRLDVEHYQPEDLELIKKLQAIGSKLLEEIADILTESDEFRSTSNGDIRYIAISDIDGRTMQIMSQQVIKPHEAPSRATYRVRNGDIVTAIAGASTGTSRHATALVTDNEDGAICSNGLAVLRNIHDVELFFLLAYMRTEYFLRQVRRLMTGHAIPAISINDLAKVLVPLPPKSIQKRISDEIENILNIRKEFLKKGERVVQETVAVINKLF